MVAKRINLKTFAGTCFDARSNDARDGGAKACRKKGLPQGEGKLFSFVERPDDAEPSHGFVADDARGFVGRRF